ncbi:MAG: hypothetical protein J3R72DRAFT_492607 [Linnemannia gamsii]|nr:MAG: hypothetical protein J3R72DRAFT_492607 [Linnemannia gamsii]
MNPSCSAPGQHTRPTVRFQRTLTLQQSSSKTITRTKTTTSTAIILLACLALLSAVSAAITCALPAGGTYKAGDGVILDWGSDSNTPGVNNIVTVNGALYCNTGVAIAEFAIPVLTGSYNWTLPSVGNATTVGGTVGTCTGNAFHMEYKGTYLGFAGLGPYPWGPVRCGTITILPAPNGTITTTTTTTTTTTSTTTSSTPSATETSGNSSGGGLSTTIIVVIAVVAAVLVTLSIVALVVCSRKRRRQRKLNNALMPWNSTLNSNNHPPSTTNNNGFSKITSSVDDEPRPHDEDGSGSGSRNAAGDRLSGASAIGGAGLAAIALKAQPMVPQPSQNQLYGDDGDFGNYGYQQQQQQQLLQQQQQQQQQQRQGYQQQGYDGYNEGEDTYYNPYYATGGMGPTTAAVVNQGNPSSFYNNHSGGGNGGGGAGSHMRLSFLPDPYQSSPDLYQMQQQRGFYPPPPVGLMTTSPNAPNATVGFVARNPERNRPVIGTPAGQELGSLGSALSSLPTTNSSESSPRRGPQIVMPEMGRREAEKAEKTEKAEAEGGAEGGNEKVPL